MYRFDSENEVAVAIFQLVLTTRPGSPRVDAPQSELALLNVNLRQRTLHEVAGMTSPRLILVHTVVEVFSQVRQRRALHRGVGIELESPTLCVDDAEPADVSVVARLLRTDIGEVLILHLIII